jgi:lysozyme
MNVKTRIAAGISAATIAAASVFIVGWEGNKTKPYLDVGGVPTACAGVTKGIDFSKIYTEAECSQMNAKAIEGHAQEVMACVTLPISQDEQVALISLGYNAGTGAICKSTLVRKLNAGEPYCDEYLRWNKVGQKEIRGLTNRRTAERALCVRAGNGK